ncbi:MAG: hypothetical protein KME30_32270 [Iphinoe sp. HA4291-MV1]|nr:hypothetical protein [Iphinoe sp. HA4291-MV1]
MTNTEIALSVDHKLSETDVRMRVCALADKETNSFSLRAIALGQLTVLAEMLINRFFYCVRVFWWNADVAGLLKNFVIY